MIDDTNFNITGVDQRQDVISYLSYNEPRNIFFDHL